MMEHPYRTPNCQRSAPAVHQIVLTRANIQKGNKRTPELVDQPPVARFRTIAYERIISNGTTSAVLGRTTDQRWEAITKYRGLYQGHSQWLLSGPPNPSRNIMGHRLGETIANISWPQGCFQQCPYVTGGLRCQCQ